MSSGQSEERRKRRRGGILSRLYRSTSRGCLANQNTSSLSVPPSLVVSDCGRFARQGRQPDALGGIGRACGSRHVERAPSSLPPPHLRRRALHHRAQLRDVERIGIGLQLAHRLICLRGWLRGVVGSRLGAVTADGHGLKQEPSRTAHTQHAPVSVRRGRLRSRAISRMKKACMARTSEGRTRSGGTCSAQAKQTKQTGGW